jgi:hypothetical protein
MVSRALEAFICLVVKRELANRGITAQNLDRWELITYPEKLMVEGKCVLHRVECRAKDGSDWFMVQGVPSEQKDHVETTNVQVITPTTEKGSG